MLQIGEDTAQNMVIRANDRGIVALIDGLELLVAADPGTELEMTCLVSTEDGPQGVAQIVLVRLPDAVQEPASG